MKCALSLLLAGALCGCATIDYCDKGGKSMVDVANTGWYFLNLIPLASGNPEAPNEVDFKLFRQTTTLQNNVRLLDYAATDRGATGVKDVSTYTSDENIFILLFTRHVIHTSAELVIPSSQESAE